MGKKYNPNHVEQLKDYHGRVWSLGYSLLAYGAPKEDFDYIMQGGESIIPAKKRQRQEWLAGAMKRMEERIPAGSLKQVRESSACCLGSERGMLAKEIHETYGSVEERFEAFSRAKLIIGNRAWKVADGSYYVSFCGEKPGEKYHCSCLRYEPSEEPMSLSWCMCCGGHIKHHFETALGVKADCDCLSSPLTSCGKKSCMFRLKITEYLD